MVEPIMQSHFICFVFAGLKPNIASIPYSLAQTLQQSSQLIIRNP